MSSYVQHEYSVNEPWSLNSNNTELSSVLDGDEELLILDNSKLDFDYDSVLKEEDEDFCRCANCLTNNRLNCLLNNNYSNSNGISMISTGNVIDEVNHWNQMSSNNTLDPSPNTFTHFNHQNSSSNGHNLSIDDHDHNDGHSHGHSHGLTGSHNWVTHCHPSQSNTGRSQAVSKANKQLIISCVLCLIFMIAEVIGGFLSNSLAIMTDAAHLMSDLASFLLSLFAIWLSQKKPTKKMSFGFHRAEVLGAVTSIFMIWILTGILVYLAVERIRHEDYEINSDAMLIVSGLGVAMNIIMGLTLSDVFCGKKPSAEDGHNSHTHSHSHSHSSHGHSHTNMNVRAALIHVLGDLIQSIGVLIAAVIIHYKPDYKIADPICTFIFSGLVMFTTFSIMKDAVYVLMEGFPPYIDYSSIKKDLTDIECVQTVHSLHIWSLTLNKNALSVHLAIKTDSDPEKVLKMAENLIRKKYDIQHTTIQVERFDARAMNSCDTCKGP